MLRTRPLRLLLCGALICLAASPAAASAKPKTQVFKMDMTVNVSTEWVSHSENHFCSDWNRILHGEGKQYAYLKVKKRLVTFRKGKLAYPGTKGTMTLPVPRAGKVTFFPLSGKVVRKAEYDLTHTGRGDTCAPGNEGNNEKPSTRTCGERKVRGGQFALVPSGGGLKLAALSLFSDPFEGECPAESTAAAMLPEPVELTHGKDALKQLRNPRVKKVVLQGSSPLGDIHTEEPWGMGEKHWGEQTSDVLWYATLRRVK